MPVVRMKWITREFVRNHPDWYFVFGDNYLRLGLGGQAKAMRGEPNSIGVATKWSPDMSKASFFTDENDLCELVVQNDLNGIEELLENEETVVIPSDGLGTGLSKLDVYAPNLLRHINETIQRYEEIY